MIYIVYKSSNPRVAHQWAEADYDKMLEYHRHLVISDYEFDKTNSFNMCKKVESYKDPILGEITDLYIHDRDNRCTNYDFSSYTTLRKVEFMNPCSITVTNFRLRDITIVCHRPPLNIAILDARETGGKTGIINRQNPVYNPPKKIKRSIKNKLIPTPQGWKHHIYMRTAHLQIRDGENIWALK